MIERQKNATELENIISIFFLLILRSLFCIVGPRLERLIPKKQHL